MQGAKQVNKRTAKLWEKEESMISISRVFSLKIAAPVPPFHIELELNSQPVIRTVFTVL